MLRFIGLIIFIFQGMVMSAGLDSVKVQGVEIPIVYEINNDLPVYHLQLVFKNSGSIQDGDHPGLAYLSARILNEGTKKEGSSDFANKLENKAISIGVSAGFETFVFDLSSLKEHAKEGKKYLKELLQDPNLKRDTLKKVVVELKGNLLRKNSDFDYLASRGLMEEIYRGTPLEYSSQGTLESVDAISLKDIREFLKQYINLKNLIIVVGGDIAIEEEKKEIGKLIESFQVGKEASSEFVKINESNATILTYKDTQQAYVYFGAPLFVKDYKSEGYKAKVASFILGASGFGSRMMEEVRVKRGLAYSAYMRLNLNKSHAYASGHLQTKLASQEDAIRVVKEVVATFVEKGVTQKELDAAKKFLLGSEPLRNELLNQRLGSAFSEFYRDLPLGYRDEELKKIEALSLKELNDFIKAHSEITKLAFSVITAKEAPKD